MILITGYCILVIVTFLVIYADIVFKLDRNDYKRIAIIQSMILVITLALEILL